MMDSDMKGMDSLTTLYERSRIDTQDKKIHVWYGDRTQLSKVLRTIHKNRYDQVDIKSIQYSKESQSKERGYGSYSLFNPTSRDFHLIYDGDYDDLDFVEAMLGYVTVEDILLPRAMGGGAASLLKNRIPVVIFMDGEDGSLNTHLDQYACTIPVHTLDP